MDGNAYLTVEQLARELHVSRRTVDRMHRSGQGPPRVRIGHRRLLCERTAVATWIAEQQAEFHEEHPRREGQAA
jgi:excisionase family DNA binding protein